MTVGTYVPQDDTKNKKFPKPNYKAILGKEVDDDAADLADEAHSPDVGDHEHAFRKVRMRHL